MTDIPERQDRLDALSRKYLRDPEPNHNGHNRPATVAGLTDDEVLALCRKAKNAAKFSDLYDAGDTTAYDSDDSAADYSLLGILKFYTQDPDQLERLMRSSRLARPKWDERREGRSWLRYSIDNALKDVGETYTWPQDIGRSRLLSSSHSPLGGGGDDDNNEPPEEPVEVVWFSELGEPKEREFLIESVGVKGYPIVAFGAGGVAKSFAMLSAGVVIASASGVDDWLSLRVLEHGHVLYLDFELDAEEQHRRVRDLCAGMGIPTPKRLAYLSGVGISPDKAFSAALSFVAKYEAKAVIIDSMGLAMQGDMERGRDVLAFHGRYINPLRRAGVTPFIVDHEGKLQAGEKHKDKSPFGSAYKAWASRSVLQFELDEYDKEASALDIRVRQTKTNFGPKIDPIGVRLTFGEKRVEISTFELPDEELIEEESKPVKERIVGALRIGPATNADLQRLTGASPGTIRNNLSHLIQAGTVVEDGYQGRSKVYSLLSSSPPPPRRNDNDDNNNPTVAELFASPPPWLVKQLEAYREDPERHIKSLCSAVAVVVLNDGARGPDVRAEVEKELER